MRFRFYLFFVIGLSLKTNCENPSMSCDGYGDPLSIHKKVTYRKGTRFIFHT